MSIINNSHVSIDTVAPTLNLGEIQLSADRRSTKEKPLSDSDRIRRIVLPATHWNSFSATLAGSTSQGLTDILRNALIAIGSDRLKDALATDPLLRSVPLADYTIAALLAWNAETASGRGSITFTRDQVENWFAESATRAAILASYSDHPKKAAILEMLATRFATLAAKNHGLKKPEDADKLLALIAPADTADTAPAAALVTEIIGRLEHIRKSLAARIEGDSISMDDI